MLPFVPINHPFDPIPQMCDMEVDQQTDPPPAQAHVGEKLGLVYGIDGFHALDLDNDKVVHDEVNTISKVDLFAIVNDREAHFAVNH
ncbi:MAG TPA: hypothetical protein VGF06_07845 [Terriglobales bacterium]